MKSLFLLTLLSPFAALAASTSTTVNNVAPDMGTLYRELYGKVEPRLQDGDYLGAVDVCRGYVEKQRDADLIGFLLDVQASFIAATGDYEKALVSMTRSVNLNGRAQDLRRYDDSAWAAARREIKWREPADVLREAAKTHDVIMISEAHHVPETRALGRELLPVLRGLGFEYLAMETLYQPIPDSPARVAMSTAPGAAAGFYFLEPQAAGLARDALKLGFKLVAYEDETFGGDREKIEAQNLYDRVLKGKPGAKVVVWAGYGHVYKRVSRSKFKAMAAWLWELTGREPFTLFQVFDGLDPHFADAPFYKPLVLDAPGRPRRPLVVMNQPGLYPALDKIKDSGMDRDAAGAPIVDGYIVHPPFERHAPGRLRPAWVKGAGRRELSGSMPAPPDLLMLVQAFPAAEGTRATPADQMIVEPDGRFELWVPEGSYLLRVRGRHGEILAEGKSVVGSAGAKVAYFAGPSTGTASSGDSKAINRMQGAALAQ